MNTKNATFPKTLVLAQTDAIATVPPVVNTTTAWPDWNTLQDRANLTACGDWMPTPDTPGYEKTWDVHIPGFAQDAQLVRVEGERALYRGETDELFYWVYPDPVRPDTDRYPTETLRGRRAEYWGALDPAAEPEA